jgi:hypothetical protein
LFATVALRIKALSAPGRADQTSANLTPASGRQDHTTSPSAATSFVSSPFDRSQAFRQPALQPRCAPDAAASTASHPAFVTTRDRPSCRNGTAGVKPLIWGSGEAEYCPSCQSAARRRASGCCSVSGRPSGQHRPWLRFLIDSLMSGEVRLPQREQPNFELPHMSIFTENELRQARTLAPTGFVTILFCLGRACC